MGSTSDIPATPTDRERELVEWADELGAAIAPFAGEHDRDATFVTEAFELLRSSGYLALPVPQVLCLTRYVHVPFRKVVPPTRRTVLQRDGFRCAYCAGSADTVDHVHPRSRGGVHVWTNVVAACSRCNHRTADRLLSELGWQLLITPSVPRGSTAVLAAAVRPHPSWQAYLAA